MNQIHHMLVTAPVTIREKYRGLKDKALITALATCRPSGTDQVAAVVLTALKTLARRHRFLTAQADDLQEQLRELAKAANPHLLSLHGVGPNSAAQLLVTAGANPDRLRSEASFAALCGTAPVPASSGKTRRYRLSRGGDRHANRALHTIALVRMSSHPRTREFVRAQRAKGRNDAEILRILKRALAREVFKSLTRGLAAPGLDDLRPARQAKNIPLSAAAAAMGTYVTKICRTELGTYPDYELAQRYRAWLIAACHPWEHQRIRGAGGAIASPVIRVPRTLGSTDASKKFQTDLGVKPMGTVDAATIVADTDASAPPMSTCGPSTSNQSKTTRTAGTACS